MFARLRAYRLERVVRSAARERALTTHSRSRSRWLLGATLALLTCSAGATAADRPLWFDGARPSAQAHQALELLAAASSHGLDAQDYDADALFDAVMQAAQGPAPEPHTIAQLDAALSAAMHGYLKDLHAGRVDPRQVHHNYTAPRRPDFDPAATLRAALTARRLGDAVRDAAPRVPVYDRLREALARYRELTGHAAWQQALPPLPGRKPGGRAKLEPGQTYAGVALLAQRLEALGDLAAQEVAAPRYAGPLVDAVVAFQQRHGLSADGVIGHATLAQLEVTPAARVRQIELTLERLRWTPLMQGPRMLVVNIPEFVLRAYEVRDGRISVRLETKVIVGRAADTRTPVFDEDMRFIEFSPYWNVPPSIAREEVVPRLRREPGFFERQGFEFVASDTTVLDTLTQQRLDAVLAGTLRIRQRPGPHNPLGGIKFVFPNREHIYLHDTPSARLFASDRRDFSHGCIRVERPVALANFVLQGMPEWSQQRVEDAMRAGASSTLRLAAPVPVVIAYGTALVVSGRVHFYPDLYGHDRRLDAALRRRAPHR